VARLSWLEAQSLVPSGDFEGMTIAAWLAGRGDHHDEHHPV
jgi:hypothetical protein